MSHIFFDITKRTMKQNKTRTIVTIIGVILSTAMITAVTTFGLSFQSFLLDYTMKKEGNWHVLANGLTREMTETMSQDELVARTASCAQIGYAKYEPVTENSPDRSYLYLRSLSEETMESIPIKLREGRMPKNDSEILVPATLLANENEEEQTKLGDVYMLEVGERYMNGQRVTPQNTFHADETAVFVPKEKKQFQVVGIYTEWQDVNYTGDAYDVLTGPAENEDALYVDTFFTLKDPKAVYDFTNKYNREETSGENYTYHNSLLRWMGVSDNSNFQTIIKGFMSVLLIVIMVGSISLIYNAFSISLRERTTQFGLLSSVGATKNQLRKSIQYEAVVVSLIGIPIGLVTGVGGIGVTLSLIGEDISTWIYGETVKIPVKISVETTVAAVFIAFLTVCLSVWIPSRRIRKLSTMEALRSSKDIKIRPKEVKTKKWVYKLFGVEGMLAQKNFKRDQKKYRATVFSLTISIILFTTAALTQMYLISTGAFVLQMPQYQISYTLYDYAQQEEKIADRIFEGNTRIDNLEKYSVTSMEIQTEEGKELYTEFHFLSDKEFLAFAKETGVDGETYLHTDRLQGVLIDTVPVFNTKTQRYEKKKLVETEKGEEITVGYLQMEENKEGFEEKGKLLIGDTTDKMSKWVQGDSGNLIVVMPRSMEQKFREKMGTDTSLRYNVQTDEYQKVYEQVEKELEQSGLIHKSYLMNQAKEYEDDKGIMTAINVLTYGFIFLITVIAVANVFNTISANLFQRRKEFAMLRSVGMPRKDLAKMMCFECMIYGFRSVIYGVLGTVLISVSLYQILLKGVDAPFLMPWKYLVMAILGTIFVVALTMLYSMNKMKKNNLIEELKMN